MIHPDTELRFISPEIGFGVVATKFIPKGTITWVLDDLDREFSPSEIQKMNPMLQHMLDVYTYRNPLGNFVLCWDHGRYVNHSFNSNCMTTAYNFEIAIRDIQPGEELTDDYGYLNVTEPFDAVPEKNTSRTRVYPDDLLNFHEQWDRLLEGAFPCVSQVPQALQSLLEPSVWEKAQRISKGQEKMTSILSCYYKGETVIRS